jgi:hypothetical protein
MRGTTAEEPGNIGFARDLSVRALTVDQRQRNQLARHLMDEFAVATGLVGTAIPRRYLWTDAFAVCNFLGLYRESGRSEDLERALRLVHQVHHVLGRYRQDDSRHGWISGMEEEEGERHPTCGGLRIGKEQPERKPDQPYDSHLEWERDGQYFHYLTQWMHALNRVGETVDQPAFNGWAVELAQTAHARFTRFDSSGQPQRMVWKMSIDLDRTLVPSMGQHDPLDALISYLDLRTAGHLDREIGEARVLCSQARWETEDPLGIGALLTASFRLARLVARHGVPEAALLNSLLVAARISLDAYAHSDPLVAGAEYRLAFRELGLAIGLHAIERFEPSFKPGNTVKEGFSALLQHQPMAGQVDDFWANEPNRESHSWKVHRDINTVMLATSLAPDGYLGT